MNSLSRKTCNVFVNKFNSEPEIVAAAPGRVNLIGEHTDYTGGFVLPVAIDKEVVFAVGKSDSGIISGYSLDFKEESSTSVGKYDPAHPQGWFRYIMGVLSELEKSGFSIDGFNFTVMGNVPIGSGLSSSAAFELAVCTAMQGLFNFTLSKKDAAVLCQRAENNFVGMNCGIMDQYISSIGKADHAVKIDCTDLSTQTIKMNTPGYSWVIIDSKKRRGLVDSEYNRRRQECEEGLVAAGKALPDRNITSLRDLATKDLPILQSSLNPTVYKRIKHVITENERVEETVKALNSGDIKSIGINLYGSHASLRDDFEVSCKELDTIVDALSNMEGVVGARLTGAGFGGCVIALVQDLKIKELETFFAKNFNAPQVAEIGKPELLAVKITDGAKIIQKAKVTEATVVNK